MLPRSKSSTGRGFTLIEILIVILIIAVLVSLVLAAAKAVQNKGKKSRAEGEIAAIATALESYKADNGDYPTNGTYGSSNPGSLNLVTTLMPGGGGKVYYEFKSKFTNSRGWIDPFLTNYNYNYATNGATNNGANNYDLWSTAGDKTGTNTNSWIKNW